MQFKIMLAMHTLLFFQDDPFTAIENVITRFQGMMTAIAGSVAVIGVMGLGMMYIGSSLPLISEWRENNPKAFRDVTWGLIFLIIASGTGLTAILTR